MNKVNQMLHDIETYGMMAKGKAEMIRHLYGEKLSFRQAVIAKCYDCLGFYADGKEDCNILTCSLYPFMPYGKKPNKKVMSDEDRQKFRDRMTKNMADKRAG